MICSCSSSFFTRVTFLPSRIGALFVSPCAPSRPLSPTALLFFVQGFFANCSSSSSGSSLSPVSFSSSFVLVPWLVFLGFGMSFFFSFFFFFFLFLDSPCSTSLSCVLGASIWSSSSVLTSLCLFFIPFSSCGFLSMGVLAVCG